MWVAELPAFVCSCPGSEIRPEERRRGAGWTGAAAVAGVAAEIRKRLLIVAGGFTGRVGGETN